MLYPDNFLAFAFLAVAFAPPHTTKFDLEAMLAYTKATYGVEYQAYWQFFCRPDAADIIQKHVCPSFEGLRYLNGH